MQLPLLSNLLGLGGPPTVVPPGAATESGAGFAQLLASLPAPQPVPVPEAPVALPALPIIAVGGVIASPQIAAQTEPDVDPTLVPPQLPTAKPATTGKGVPHAGKLLPVLLPAKSLLPDAVAEVPVTPTTKLIEVQPATDETEPLPVPLAPESIALWQNLGLLPQLSAPVQALAPEQQLAVTVGSTLPLAAPIERPRKDREPLVSQPSTLALEIESEPPSASPPLTATIPLARIHSQHPPRETLPTEPSAPLPPPPQLASPQPTAPAFPVNSESPAAPEIELSQIIERLVENRIHARETRSEVKLAHPDFGRVTLALNLAGQDRLGLTMPGAPAELRAAVGQAFAPPTRSEPAPAADTAFTSSSDARNHDARREQQSSGNRADPSRATTDAAHNRRFTTTGDNGRKASGRGVLA